MGKDDVEAREEVYFEHWCARIHALADEAGAEVTPFEHNLEVWRQLWRVTEFSDAVLLVTDARYPTFHLPPSLVRELAGRAVIVLNKVDLVSAAHVRAWVAHLGRVYPGVPVVEFSSRPPPEDQRGAGGLFDYLVLLAR